MFEAAEAVDVRGEDLVLVAVVATVAPVRDVERVTVAVVGLVLVRVFDFFVFGMSTAWDPENEERQGQRLCQHGVVGLTTAHASVLGEWPH